MQLTKNMKYTHISTNESTYSEMGPELDNEPTQYSDKTQSRELQELLI